MVDDHNSKVGWNAGWKSSSFSLTFGAVADHAQGHANFRVNFHFSSLVKWGSDGWHLCEVFWELQENLMLVTKPVKND